MQARCGSRAGAYWELRDSQEAGARVVVGEGKGFRRTRGEVVEEVDVEGDTGRGRAKN